ncbi:DUF2982 domain-containing protein [Vibrio sp. SCSIO 43136]|uniref:DUF2982 domain-containing protein n=1 Tax=Vibrio sp. SCSIO 43136 TaxID=2819101 RepID=UPI0020759A4B|nr:DUF2982 domain-containing protein [Vibrio sp. SCSIO 43136]USD66396.1 DUF2982 domain-containing protein [Vibrio sp. SCSIO 43136]
MRTLQLSNIPFRFGSPTGKVLLSLVGLISAFLLILSPGIPQALMSLVGVLFIGGFTYVMIEKARVGYTLTDTHFQQHLFKGGWVIRWQDVEQIGVCTYQQEGWHQPLPWIGIKLNNYCHYLESICPRIATQILLEQRSLLYLGMKQAGNEVAFEDIVLDSQDYICNDGQVYTGLQAMLANRMRHQRAFFGYDIFIAQSDLERDIDEFVGLIRRYKAAAPSTEA